MKIILNKRFFEDQRQIQWHLNTYGHLPSECGWQGMPHVCPWQKATPTKKSGRRG